MKSFRDYLELSNSCSYDVDDVIGRADRFGFQNFCSPGRDYKNKQQSRPPMGHGRPRVQNQQQNQQGN